MTEQQIIARDQTHDLEYFDLTFGMAWVILAIGLVWLLGRKRR